MLNYLIKYVHTLLYEYSSYKKFVIIYRYSTIKFNVYIIIKVGKVNPQVIGKKTNNCNIRLVDKTG
jgi:hypothetical protein